MDNPPSCVCGHPAHPTFPKTSCACGCSIYEADRPIRDRHDRDLSDLSVRLTSHYEWLLALGDAL